MYIVAALMLVLRLMFSLDRECSKLVASGRHQARQEGVTPIDSKSSHRLIEGARGLGVTVRSGELLAYAKRDPREYVA